MYCLDSSVIIGIFRGDKGLIKKISGISPDGIFFTELTLCELFKGAYKSAQKEKSLELIHEFSRNYNVIGLSIESCEAFGMDFNVLAKAGKQTQEFDLMTAVIAKQNNLILVTRKSQMTPKASIGLRHFENIPNLKLEEW